MTTEPFKFDLKDFDFKGKFNWVWQEWSVNFGLDEDDDSWTYFEVNEPRSSARDDVVALFAGSLECQDFEPATLNQLVQDLAAGRKKASELSVEDESLVITAMLAEMKED